MNFTGEKRIWYPPSGNSVLDLELKVPPRKSKKILKREWKFKIHSCLGIELYSG